jgi:hypothetical protein
MEAHRHTPAIGRTVVDLVGAGTAIEHEAVAHQGADELLRGETPQCAIVDGHGSDGDGDQGLVGHPHLVGGGRDRLAVLDHALDH